MGGVLLGLVWVAAGVLGSWMYRSRGLREFPDNPPLAPWLLALMVVCGAGTLAGACCLWLFDRIDAA